MVTSQVFKILLVVGLLLTGCSSPTIIYRDILVPIPAIADTVYMQGDTIWTGAIHNTYGDSVGSIAVEPKSKKAVVRIERDTVIVCDTVKVNNATNSILPVLVNSFSWWEAGIWFGGMGLLTGLIAYLRLKRGKIV